MNKLILFMVLVSLALAACSSSGAVVADVASAGDGTAVTRLNENFSEALPVQSQLAVGTLQLENGENAVSEAQAAELLPLWRAVQSLANSDTTAVVEIEAVLNQIQDAMTPEQIGAIAAMQLTQESVQTMIAEGTLALGGGGFGMSRDSSDTSPLSGLAAGGGPGGGGPGGGMPGGGMPGGGDPGAMGGGLGGDPSAMATRMAASGEDGGISAGSFQVMAMTNSVIRLLEMKTGDMTMPDGFAPFNSVITAVAEATGLGEDEVRAAAAGQTFAEIIEANGGDVTAVTAQLVAALQNSPMLQDQDTEAFVTDLLNGNGRFPGS